MVEKYENLNIPSKHMGYLKKISDTNRPQLWKLHSHRELEFNLVTEGTGYYVINDHKYFLTKGTIIWLFPDQKHVLMECSDDFKIWVAVFNEKLVNSICTNSAEILITKDPGKIYMGELLSYDLIHLENTFKDIIAYKDDEGFLNSGLAYVLRRAWAAFENADKSHSNQYLHQAVVRIIEEVTSSPLNEKLSALAGKSGLSYSRLTRVFKNQTGQSLQEFRDRVRLERFCNAFGKEPHRTMIDCALDSGFGSYAQFYRTFKKHMNKSPKEFWLQKNTEENHWKK